MATLTLRPTGAGNSTQWTPSAGSNWQNVDESSADGDTTYNSASGGGGLVDLFTTGAGVPAGAPVNSVTFTARGRHTGAYGFIQIMLRSGGTTQSVDAITKIFTGSYADYSSAALANNPITAAAWTAAEVNAMEIGYYDLSSSPAMRVTQLYAVVDYDEPITTTLASELAAVVFTAGGVTQTIPSTIASQIAKVTAEILATHTPNLTPTIATQVAKAVASISAFHGTDPALTIGAVLTKVGAALTATRADDATIASTLANIEAALATDVDTASLMYKNTGHGFRSGSPHFRGGR